MLSSQRIAAAPTLEFLLTRDQPRTDVVTIPSPRPPLVLLATAEDMVAPLNDLQMSMVVAVIADRLKRGLTADEIQQLRQRVPRRHTPDGVLSRSR